MFRIYLSRNKVAISLIIQMTALAIFFLKQDSNIPLPEEKPQKVHVLILSTWRSGSSIVGQVFSQHPDVFYLMEPGWHVWGNIKESNYKVLQAPTRDLLRSIFQCDMSAYDFYLPENKNKSNLFMWKFSRALCTPPACDMFQRTDITIASDCKILCGHGEFSTVEKTCRTYSHVALKEVRLFNLKSLYPLLTDPNLNLRIIHLIRDPRAVFNSREIGWASLHSDTRIIWNAYDNRTKFDQYKVMGDICGSQAQIYRKAAKEAPPFLKDRYLMVRYEDLVRDPLTKVKEMYKFTNLSLTPKLVDWINKMTHGSGVGSLNQAFDITSRNALNVSQAWRNKLTFQAVAKVQEVCKEMMDLVGYRLAKSEKEQKSLTHNLLVHNIANLDQMMQHFW